MATLKVGEIGLTYVDQDGSSRAIVLNKEQHLLLNNAIPALLGKLEVLGGYNLKLFKDGKNGELDTIVTDFSKFGG